MNTTFPQSIGLSKCNIGILNSNFTSEKLFTFLLFLLMLHYVDAQTPVPMATQPGKTYTENFADIANWTNGFAAGIGANRWTPKASGGLGTIPNGINTPTSTLTFVTTTNGGVQRGTSQTPSAQNIVLLTTGASNNSSAAAIDFHMDFTGVNPGTLSYDAATVFNQTGNRAGAVRVYWSIDGVTFTELAGASYIGFNNVVGSATISNITLPLAFSNVSTARLRFYGHNEVGGTTGSRPKISIDNLTVTATCLNLPIIAETIIQPTCQAPNGGEISLSISGANDPYTY